MDATAASGRSVPNTIHGTRNLTYGRISGDNVDPIYQDRNQEVAVNSLLEV